MPLLSPKTTDIELINLIKQGNAKALRILYQRYSGLVYSTAFKILQNQAEAEDITQEVFLTFWQRDNFNPDRASLSTFLCLLTRSKALNRCEYHNSRTKTLERFTRTVPMTMVELTPLEQATRSEQIEAVQKALAEIPPSQRTILELNFYNGASHSQIAQKLGMPLGTVKSNARQGLIKLRKLLGNING